MPVRSIFFAHCPEEMSQTRMDRSREAETMSMLFGEKQTQVIQSVCPRSRDGGISRFECLILMILSSFTDAVNRAFETIVNGSPTPRGRPDVSRSQTQIERSREAEATWVALGENVAPCTPSVWSARVR